MNLPVKHPTEEVLLEYALGVQEEAIALVVATHLTFCPRCRGFVAEQEALLAAGLLGGDRNEAAEAAAEPDPLTNVSLARALAVLDEHPQAPPKVAPTTPELLAPFELPWPLLRYVPADSRWRFIAPGVRGLDLAVSCAGQRARLVRFRPGYTIPSHTHEGNEWVLVLRGGFTDQREHYVRGDVDQKDASVIHEVVIDDDDLCLALVVLDAPLSAQTLLGKLLQRISGY